MWEASSITSWKRKKILNKNGLDIPYRIGTALTNRGISWCALAALSPERPQRSSAFAQSQAWRAMENWGLTSPKRSRQIPSKIVIESLNCRAKTFAFSIHCILLIWLFRPFNHSDKFIFSRASRLWPGFHRLTTACSYSSCGWTLGIWSSVEGEPEKALLLAGGRLAWQWCASRGRCLWFQLAICEGIGLWSSKKQPGWFGIVPTFHIWLSINFRGTVPKFHQISVTPQIADRK